MPDTSASPAPSERSCRVDGLPLLTATDDADETPRPLHRLVPPVAASEASGRKEARESVQDIRNNDPAKAGEATEDQDRAEQGVHRHRDHEADDDNRERDQQDETHRELPNPGSGSQV